MATEKTAQADFKANRALEAKAARKQKRRATKLDQKRKADVTAAWAEVAVAAEKERAAESPALVVAWNEPGGAVLPSCIFMHFGFVSECKNWRWYSREQASQRKRSNSFFRRSSLGDAVDFAADGQRDIDLVARQPARLLRTGYPPSP